MIAWVILMAVFSVTLVRGLRFRSGESRVLLTRYRDPNKPAVYRNSPLVMPLSSAIFLILLIAGAGAFVLGWPGDDPRPSNLLLAVFAFGGAMIVLGLLPWLLIRPHVWLIPAWLAEDDARTGWAPPPPSGLDWFLVAGGMVCAGCGALLILYGLATVAGR